MLVLSLAAGDGRPYIALARDGKFDPLAVGEKS